MSDMLSLPMTSMGKMLKNGAVLSQPAMQPPLGWNIDRHWDGFRMC